MRLHQDAVMRTTLDLPDDLHRVLTSMATHSRRSLSQTAVDLIQRGLATPAQAGLRLKTHPKTGLPLLQTARPITPEDVKALEDPA